METHQSEKIIQAVAEMIEPECTIFSNKSTSYVDLKDMVKGHYTEIQSTETTKSALKWVHIAISNTKRVFNGVYQKISLKFIQLYHNEFRYKLNRRYFVARLFNRLTLIRYECGDSK